MNTKHQSKPVNLEGVEIMRKCIKFDTRLAALRFMEELKTQGLKEVDSARYTQGYSYWHASMCEHYVTVNLKG